MVLGEICPLGVTLGIAIEANQMGEGAVPPPSPVLWSHVWIREPGCQAGWILAPIGADPNSRGMLTGLVMGYGQSPSSFLLREGFRVGSLPPVRSGGVGIGSPYVPLTSPDPPSFPALSGTTLGGLGLPILPLPPSSVLTQNPPGASCRIYLSNAVSSCPLWGEGAQWGAQGTTPHQSPTGSCFPPGRIWP